MARVENTATATGLHPQTEGIAPASASPLPCTRQQGKPILFYFNFYFILFISSYFILPYFIFLFKGFCCGFPCCPSWDWVLGLRHSSPEEPPKPVSGALSWLLPADQTSQAVGTLLAPPSWGVGAPVWQLGELPELLKALETKMPVPAPMVSPAARLSAGGLDTTRRTGGQGVGDASGSLRSRQGAERFSGLPQPRRGSRSAPDPALGHAPGCPQQGQLGSRDCPVPHLAPCGAQSFGNASSPAHAPPQLRHEARRERLRKG